MRLLESLTSPQLHAGAAVLDVSVGDLERSYGKYCYNFALKGRSGVKQLLTDVMTNLL